MYSPAIAADMVSLRQSFTGRVQTTRSETGDVLNGMPYHHCTHANAQSIPMPQASAFPMPDGFITQQQQPPSAAALPIHSSFLPQQQPSPSIAIPMPSGPQPSLNNPFRAHDASPSQQPPFNIPSYHPYA